MDFDPYYNWLGIPPAEQPANHYRLLGLALFEENPDAISNAADRVMAHLRTYQTGKHAALSQRLLSEVAQARICLLDTAKKGLYDRELLARLAPQSAAEAPHSEPSAAPSPVVVTPVRRPVASKATRKRKTRALELTLTIGGLLVLMIIALALVYLWPLGPQRNSRDERKNEPSPIATRGEKPGQPIEADEKERTSVDGLPSVGTVEESPDKSPKAKTPAKKKKPAKKPAPTEKKMTARPSESDARKLWVHSNGTFRQLDSGRWEEIVGNRKYSFVELGRNAEYVELLRSPATYIRLYDDHCDVKVNDDGKYRRLYTGSWKAEATTGTS